MRDADRNPCWMVVGKLMIEMMMIDRTKIIVDDR